MRRVYLTSLALTAALGLLAGTAMPQQVKGPVHITARGVTYGVEMALYRDGGDEEAARAERRETIRRAREEARAQVEQAREEAREQAEQALENAREARAEVQQAMVEARQQRRDALAQVKDAKNDLDNAERDLVEQEKDAARMQAGDFSDAVTIDNGVIKCGDPSRHPGCQPYSEAEKAEMLKDLRQGLADGRRGLEDARGGLADAERALSEEVYP